METRTNKQIFDDVISFLKTKHIQHSVTEKEDYISYSFVVGPKLDLGPARDICKQFKYTPEAGEDLMKHYFPENPTTLVDSFDMSAYASDCPNIVNNFTTVIYNKIRDKFSISTFTVGYMFGHRKLRYYPVRLNTPVLCKSKHFYSFFKPRNKGKNKVRHWKSQGIYNFLTDKMDIERIILGVDYLTGLNYTARHYYGTKNDIEVIERVHNYKVPKALRHYTPSELDRVLSCLSNHGELNKLCQYLSKTKEPEVLSESLAPYRGIGSLGIYSDLCGAIGMDREFYWLLRDWFSDCQTLKKKISIKANSVQRYKDEHQKMSMEIMLKHTPELKVHECYKHFSENFPIEHELITNKDRLIQESYEMHHCVGTYAGNINDGRCGILAIKWEGKRYTMEVSYINPGFYIGQLKGVTNESPPKELYNKSVELCGRINYLPRNLKSIVVPVPVIQQEMFAGF